MIAFDDAPAFLVVVALISSALGAVLLGVLVWHVFRRLANIPRVPLGLVSYVVMVVFCAAFFAVGAGALATAALYRDYERIGTDARVARVRCAKNGTARVSLTLQPLTVAEPRPEERYDLAGDSCAIAVDVVKLRGPLSRLGADVAFRVSKVGAQTRPLRNPAWLAPGGAATLSPLRLVVREANEQPLVNAPSDGATYFLVSSPDGVRVEKAPAGT